MVDQTFQLRRSRNDGLHANSVSTQATDAQIGLSAGFTVYGSEMSRSPEAASSVDFGLGRKTAQSMLHHSLDKIVL
jgi:hypothetical protein